jgi:hypothetical protein
MEAGLKAQGNSIFVEEGKLHGGVNASMHDTELPPGHLKSAVNLFIDKAGTLALRKGYLLHSTIPSSNAGDVTILGLGRFKSSDGTEYLCAAYWDTQGSVGAAAQLDIAYYSGGSWNVIGRVNPSATLATTGFNPTAKCRMIMMDDLLVIMNGVDRPICWDGTNYIAWYGVDGPLAPTGMLAINAGGAMGVGCYFYIIAYYNSDYDLVSYAALAPDPALGNNWIEIVAPNDAVRITLNDPAVDEGVEFVRIYRTLAAAPTPPNPADPPLSAYYFVWDEPIAGMPMNFGDVIADSTIMNNATFLSDHLTGLLDHSLPPTAMNRAVVHNSRLFSITENAGDESILFWSRVNRGAYNPALYNMEIDPGAGSNLAGLASLSSGVVTFKGDSTGVVTTYGAQENWEFRQVSQEGCIAPDTIKAIQDRRTGTLSAVRLTKNGLMQTDGSVDLKVMEQAWPLIGNATNLDFAKFRAFHEKVDNLYILQGPPFVPLSGLYSPSISDETTMPHGLIVHLDRPVYITQTSGENRFSGYATTMTTTSFDKITDEVMVADDYIFGTLSGAPDEVYMIWTGYQDLSGNTIEFQFRSRPIIPYRGFAKSRFQNIFVAVASLTASFDVYYEVDRGASSGLFENLEQFIGSTFLDYHVYERHPAPTVANIAGGSLPVGTYYVILFYEDTGTNERTLASEVSTMVTVAGGGNNTIRCTGIAASADAQDKYDTMRAAVKLTSQTGDQWTVINETAAIGAATLDLLALTGEVGNFDTEELYWSNPSVNFLRLPNRGRLQASAVGEMIELVMAGDTSDGELRFVRFGIKAKPKQIR